MRIHALQCFGEHAGGGNPALVIEDHPSSPEDRLAFAAARKTTCVWLDASEEAGVAGVVDFYYPHARSPLCVHATLAVARVLSERHGADAALAVKTAMRGQRLGLAKTAGDYFVQLAEHAAPQPPQGAALLARLLDAPGLAPASPPRVTSIGSPKLLVEVADPAILHGLAPDLHAIAAWSKEAGVNGCYAWCRREDGRYEGRNFNHLDPALEDSATGVAAGALTLLLRQGISLLQGRATGRACLIRTRIEGNLVFVGGRVEDN